MDISIKSISDYECDFILHNSSPSIANALRKTLMSHVPIFAIHHIHTIQNTSVIIDEQIIQRLHYIPFISSNIDEYKAHNECDCDKECKECSIQFSINVTNTTNKIIDVTSFDIQTDHSIIKPFHDSTYGIIITKLVPGQKCIINGNIKKGYGKQHSKWSPVSTVSYNFLPVIDISNQLKHNKDNVKQLISVCPTNVFSDIEDLKINQEKCTLCNECVYKFPKDIKVGYITNTISFKVESTGSLKVNTIIEKALDILKEL